MIRSERSGGGDYQEKDINNYIARLKRKQAIVVGCETDVCVLRLPPASPPRSSKAKKDQRATTAADFASRAPRHRRSGARIAENGFATSRGVSKSAKVVLVTKYEFIINLKTAKMLGLGTPAMLLPCRRGDRVMRGI